MAIKWVTRIRSAAVITLGLTVLPIPTVSDWGFVAMGVLLLTAGTLVFMRCHPVKT
jgi:hypothetical protein